MTAHRAFNLSLAALIAAILSTSYLLDGPDDIAAERAQVMAMEDAVKAQVRASNMDKAARKICGDTAGWTINYDEQIVCLGGDAKRTVALNH